MLSLLTASASAPASGTGAALPPAPACAEQAPPAGADDATGEAGDAEDDAVKGRVLRPFPLPADATEEETKLIQHVNEYISTGGGVSIPRSVFSSMVRVELADTLRLKEVENVRPSAMTLLQCESEKYITELFQRANAQEWNAAKRPMVPGSLQYERAIDKNNSKLVLHYDSNFEDDD
eukprot:1791724-Rhodomonas_salina.1